jgi:hypothetical protein
MEMNINRFLNLLPAKNWTLYDSYTREELRPGLSRQSRGKLPPINPPSPSASKLSMKIPGSVFHKKGNTLTNGTTLWIRDPNPEDPYVFGPSGSGSISQSHGCGSFYHQAEIIIKTLSANVL